MRKSLVSACFLALTLSACAGTQSEPLNSKCFTARGDLKCDLRPLPELWGEARQDAVEQVGYYEGAVEDGPYGNP